MASGIERSHRKIEFARRILPDGDYMRGPYRCRESPVDVSTRKYEYSLKKGLLPPIYTENFWSFRKKFQNHGYKAPNLKNNGQSYFKNLHDERIKRLKALQEEARIKGEGYER